jgi:hypothetical protein
VLTAMILIVIVIVVIVFQKGMGLLGQLWDKGERKVLNKSYRAGSAEIRRALQFSAPVPRAQLQQGVIDALGLRTSAPFLWGNLYLKERTGDRVVIALGNKMGTALRARVDFWETEGGAAGAFAVTDWQESGSSVIGRERVGPLIERISHAVAGLSGAAQESDSDRMGEIQ